MYQKLKKEIKDIIEISKQCPEGLQEKCFELLLENFLNSNKSQKTENSVPTKVDESLLNIDNTLTTDEGTIEHTIDSETEITLKDFHVKIQRFLNTNAISIDNINYLYYKEDGKLMPLYETLNSTNMSECQVRLALLTAFENSFSDSNGEMIFGCDVVRARCNAMKCYNASNFSSYFKNNISLWENWPDKPTKNSKISLSTEGKKELAKILLELSKGE